MLDSLRWMIFKLKVDGTQIEGALFLPENAWCINGGLYGLFLY